MRPAGGPVAPGRRPLSGPVGAAPRGAFLTGNLFRHVSVMSLTASVGLVALFLVDFLDMLFISMLGNAALAAAVGYAGSILFFTTSVGIGMSIAAGAVVARAVGAGDAAEVRRRATNSLVFAAAVGVATAAGVVALLGPLTALVGASGETQVLAIGYLVIVVPSLPLLMIGMAGGAILRAHGDARRAMWTTLAGGIVNAVLDPILIFGLGLELTGAALASVAARITIAVAALWPILRHHGGLEMPRPPGLASDLRPVFGIAVPAMLTQVATPVGLAYVLRSMAEFGESAVAGMAVIIRMTPLAFVVIFALSGSIGPIVAQNAGAGAFDRVRRGYRAGLVFVGLYTLFIAALLYALRGPLAAMFGATGEMRDVLMLFCGPLALLWFFNGVIFVSNAAFNNLGHPFWSTWLNWGRHTLGTVPFVALGASVAGAEGVLLGQAAGGVIFAVVALWLSRIVIDRAETPPPRPPFARQARLLRLFSLTR